LACGQPGEILHHEQGEVNLLHRREAGHAQVQEDDRQVAEEGRVWRRGQPGCEPPLRDAEHGQLDLLITLHPRQDMVQDAYDLRPQRGICLRQELIEHQGQQLLQDGIQFVVLSTAKP